MDPKVLRATPHGGLSTLVLAIGGSMEIWSILAEIEELSDEEKLYQMNCMMDEGFEEGDEVCKVFDKLLSSFPVELVIDDYMETFSIINHHPRCRLPVCKEG